MEEVPEDSAFSMTAALNKENSLEVCAKVCLISNLQEIGLKQFSPPVHWGKGGDQDGGDGD